MLKRRASGIARQQSGQSPIFSRVPGSIHDTIGRTLTFNPADGVVANIIDQQLRFH
ncbi:hypothetical protein D3C87_1206790 [compost metagenome]